MTMLGSPRRIFIALGLASSLLGLSTPNAAQPDATMQSLPQAAIERQTARRQESSGTYSGASRVALSPAPQVASEDPRRSFQFAGYSWRVRETGELEGPGPNYFSNSPDAAWVDDAGGLHLRVAPAEDGRWYAVEVASSTSLGYGTYQFTIDSQLDNLDPNVVLGLFTWSDDPTENHRELDVEFARFGQRTGPAGRYTVQPYTEASNVFRFTQPPAQESTHSFRWDPNGVAFRSWVGASEAPEAPNTDIAQHLFSRSAPHPADEQVHLNLWLDAGRAPSDGQPIEVVIANFTFTPLN